MLPPSLPSRHFVFHPVDINNMASYDNEKGTIFYRARLLLASRCILYITLVMAQLLLIHRVSGWAMVSHICHSTQLSQCLSPVMAPGLFTSPPGPHVSPVQ